MFENFLDGNTTFWVGEYVHCARVYSQKSYHVSGRIKLHDRLSFQC